MDISYHDYSPKPDSVVTTLPHFLWSDEIQRFIEGHKAKQNLYFYSYHPGIVFSLYIYLMIRR